MKNKKKMNNLPFEFFPHIYENVFGYLNVDDLLNVRLVCRGFNVLLMKYKIEELVFDHLKIRSSLDKWSDLPINYHYAVDKSKLFLFKSSMFNIKLKRFKICGYFEINLEVLNKFSQLEHLEIIYCFKIVEVTILSLQNLKLLKICSEDVLDLELDLPNLQALFLYCESYKNIKFNYTRSIQYLSISDYDDYFLKFKNIEYLDCYGTFSLSWLELRYYLKLKVIHIHYDESEFIKTNKQNAELNKQNLKIYQKGLLVVDGKEIHNYDFFEDELHCLMDNYAKTADSLDFVWLINYNALMRLVNYKLPVDFFKKFNSILKIEVFFVEDEKQLKQFIKRCLNLKSLSVNKCKLSQQFYEELPSLTCLSYLYVVPVENIVDGEIELNFKFINRMFNLVEFVTSKKLNLNEEFDLIRLRYLKRIRIQIDKINELLIEKLGRDRYNVTVYNQITKISKLICKEIEFIQIIEVSKSVKL